MNNDIAMFIFGWCATGVLKEIGQFIRAMFNPVAAKDKELNGELFGRGEVVGGAEWAL